MQLLNVNQVWTYLPNDKAPVPFGDPVPVTSISNASPGVVTIPGEYVPVNGDAVSLSTTGALPTGLSVATQYYVVASSGETFSLAATKGGSAINTSSAGSGVHTLHLLSNQVDGVSLPFKPNNTVLVANLSGGSLTLQGAADLNTTSFGQPLGPNTGAISTIATLGGGTMALVTLGFDWIRVSTSATLALIQN